MTRTLENLALAIRDLWREGWPVGEEVLAFAEATFGGREPACLDTLLRHPGEHGAEALCELVFYPDEAAQIRLEPILEDGAFATQDGDTLLRLLREAAPAARLRLPSGQGVIEVPVPDFCLPSFVSRLHIDRAVPSGLRGVLGEAMPPGPAARARVRLRNARFPFAANTVRFLAAFFASLPAEDPDFWPCLDLILSLMEGWDEAADPFEALMAGKRFLFQSLQRYDNARARLLQHNLETLALGRTPIPALNPEETRLRLRRIDHVAMAVFQTTEYLPPSADARVDTWPRHPRPA